MESVNPEGVRPLAPNADSIQPLPMVLHYGLRGVVALASLSLLTTTLLFTHLTYKLIRYNAQRIQRKIARKNRPKQTEWRNNHDSVDLTLGLDELHFGATKSIKSRSNSIDEDAVLPPCPPPNQFVVLLYNLLLADMHQAMAFFLNVVWVAGDGIFVHTPACWTQGLFISNGDLASSCFIATIALHTYLTVVREYRPPEWALNAWIVGTWIFVYGITIAGIESTGNGRDAGGYFVRAAAWCWINDAYDNLRLITHYMYIFIALVATPVVYGAIFLHLRTRLIRDQMLGRMDPFNGSSKNGNESDNEPLNLTGGQRPPLRHKGSVLDVMTAPSSSSISNQQARGTHGGVSYDHHPAFLIYPLIYVVCTLPLALGRVGSLAGAEIPLWYFCVAGALITSNGWLDCLLWGSTRHTIVFGPLDNADALGLETFNFMRTPPGREFGNMVWVQGRASEGGVGGGGGGGGAHRGSRRPGWGGLVDKVRGRSVVASPSSSGVVGEGVAAMGPSSSGGGELGVSGSDSSIRSGILGRPDVHSTYRSGHVKMRHATDVDMFDSRPGSSRRGVDGSDRLPPVNGSIAIKKDLIVTVVTIDKDDLESGYSTPGSRSAPPSSHSGLPPVKDGYFS